MTKTIWTKEETEFVKNNYETMKQDEILKFLNEKTKDQLRWKAKNLKLKKQVSRSKSKIELLLDLTSPEICYWWGFITADGCFSEKQLILAAEEKDESHLKKFADKFNCNISSSTRINYWTKKPYTMKRVALRDYFMLPIIKERFEIETRKTYNPFNINEFMSQDKILFFLAGLTDGDGYLEFKKSKWYTISIKTHPNWSNNFKLIKQSLMEHYGIESHIRYTKEGWVVFSINRKKHIQFLFEKIKDNVPYMERKWGKIKLENS